MIGMWFSNTADFGNTLAMRSLKFGIGSISNGIMTVIPGVLLLYYLTIYVHIPPAQAGLLIVIPKILSIFLDPVVGHLSDRLKSRSEWHRRLLMIAGGASVTGGVSLLFALPTRVAHGGLVAAVLYLWAGCGFSLFSVPNAALPADIESLPARRRSLVATRMVFGMIGGILGTVVGPMIVDVAGYDAMGIFLGVAGGGAIAICALTYSYDRSAAPATPMARCATPQKLSFKALADRRYLSALGGFALLVIAHSTSNAALPFLVQQQFRQSSAEFGKTFFISIGTATIATMLWPMALKHIDEKTTWWTASLLMITGNLLAVFANGLNLIFKTGLVLAGLGYPVVQILGYITLANVASQTEVDGRAGSGIMAGFWSASDKLANNLGPLIVGIILQVGTKPDSRSIALFIAVGALPAALAAAALPILLTRRVQRF